MNLGPIIQSEVSQKEKYKYYKLNWKWSNRRWQENVNILGIRELKWTGMGEFNSDDNFIYYCEQESLRRNAVVVMVNKRV